MNNRHGKAFERELLLSLRAIPHSFADRNPGTVQRRGRRLKYVQPAVDLLFVGNHCVLYIECKATKSDRFYVTGWKNSRKYQYKKLLDFNKIGKKFHGVLAIKFVKQRKVVFITDFNIKKVTPNMPGIKKVKGVWQVGDYIDEYKGRRKSKKIAT